MLKKKCFLPRTLKIKFGGEYSSVYYSTIRGLNAHSMYTYLTMCVEYTENLTK